MWQAENLDATETYNMLAAVKYLWLTNISK